LKHLGFCVWLRQDHTKKSAERAAAGKAFREAIEHGHAGVPAQSSSAGSSKSRVCHQKLNLTNVKKYAPPNSQLFHDPTQDRIRGYYHIGGRRPSHGCSLSFGIDVACRVVVDWLWVQHLQHHPKAIKPWDFPYTIEEAK